MVIPSSPAAAQPAVPGYVEDHRDGDTVWIDMLWVEPGERGHGLGRRLYTELEASLPPEVTLVRVFAADTDGAGNSDGFWLSLGFAYRWDGGEDVLSYEASHALVRGVNRHPTPAPIGSRTP